VKGWEKALFCIVTVVEGGERESIDAPENAISTDFA
jgi:hypothetical protein